MMLRLAAATIRQRWISLAGAFAAVALGVAIVVPMLLVLAAATGAHPPGPERFAAAPAVVVPGGTLSLPYDGVTVTLPLGDPGPLPPALVAAFGPLGAVRHAAGGQATVLTGAARSQADPDPSDGGQLIVGVEATAGIAVAIVSFVATCVVLGTFAFVAELRRRELALLRLAGMTAGQVRQLVVTEAAVLGVAGSLAGCAAGAAGANLAGRVLVRAGVAPAWFTVGLSSWPLLAGFAVGVTFVAEMCLTPTRRTRWSPWDGRLVL